MPADDRRIAAARHTRKFWLLLLAGLIGMLASGPAIHAPDYHPTRAAIPVAAGTPLPSPDPSPVRAPAHAGRQLSLAAGDFVNVAVTPAEAALPTPVLPSVLGAPHVPLSELAPSRPALLPRLVPTPEPEPSIKPTREAKPTSKSTPKPTPKPEREAKATSKPTPKPSPTPRPSATPKPSPEAAAAASYSGKMRLWYPALGIDARWKWYGCEYGETSYGLDKGVYRWGCTPKNNIYLMSHAWSTFKAIKKGYHSGRMKVGQSVYYANPKGRVTEWKVKWIKRVRESYFINTFSDWASNDSPTPIMTFQTCDGRNDEYRIIIRLVPAR